VRQGRFRAEEGAAGVDLVHEVVALHLGVQRVGERDRARVVDADVDAAEGRDALLDRGADLLLVADVADDRQRLAAGGGDLLGGAEDRPRQLGVRLGSLRREDDVGAVAGEPRGDRQADAAARARNEHCPALQCHGVPPVVVGERALSTSAAKSTASGRAPVRRPMGVRP
jgi:hypothetical protein